MRPRQGRGARAATYYDILGLDPHAGKEEIRSSYRQLAMRYHPDRNTGSRNAHAIFITVHNAYTVLIDETTKREYDAYLAGTANRMVPCQPYGKKLDPKVQKTLSMFNSLLWDLEDLLKKMDMESMMRVMGKITLYDHILNLLGYLEKALLGRSDRFSTYSGKQHKTRLHVDNYFYLLRMDMDKVMSEAEDDPRVLERIVSVENELIRSLSEMRRYL